MTEQIRTVLFVDDEENIINALKRQLRNSEFAAMFASSGNEALRLIEENDIQVIVTDEKMPDMRGIELLQKVKELHPDIVRIILSGFTDSTRLIRSINQGEIFRFIPKPWTADELDSIIKDGFTRHNTLQGFKIYMQRMIEDNITLMKKLKSYETSFEINSDIINMMPQPIIAVSGEGNAALINRAAKAFLGGAITEGTLISEIFDAIAADRIIAGLNLPEGQTSFTVNYGDRHIRIYTNVFGEHHQYKGFLFFEKEC